MGSCVSSQVSHPTAMLILDDGGLREFLEPVKAEQILREMPGFFVCHSDSMAFDEYLSTLPADAELQVGHIYFLLPLVKSQYPLRASDMAALAVKAAAAMQEREYMNNNKCWRCKIMPVVEHNMDGRKIHPVHSVEEFSHYNYKSERLKSRNMANMYPRKMKLTPIPEASGY